MANVMTDELCPECLEEGINIEMQPSGGCSFCPKCGHSKCK